MKRQRIILLYALSLLIALLFAACEGDIPPKLEEEQPTEDPSSPTTPKTYNLELSETALDEVSCEGAAHEITVTADTAWTSDTGEYGWITVTPSKSKAGEVKTQITIAANDADAQR